MKIKLFTHTDLDGVGCAIIANHVFGKENVDVEYCDYKDINAKVASFFQSGFYKGYNRVFITDISVNAEVAEIIDHVAKNYFKTIQLIDHHTTAVWLEKYSWADVIPTFFDSIEGREKKTCGTSLLLDYLGGFDSVNEHTPIHELYRFAEQVRRYDTWDWHDVYHEEYPKRLNDLLYLIGRRKFVDRFNSSLSLQFTEDEEQRVSAEETKIKYYIESASKNIFPASIQGYNAGVVFAELYTSELGNVLATKFPEFDFIAIVNAGNGTISYRGVKKEIDLGKDIASMYGGGGQPRTAGSQIKPEDLNKLIIELFEH